MGASGLDPSAKMNYCIRFACTSGHLVIVKLLLDYGNVDPSVCENLCYRYAEKYGVDHKYWRFLTGKKQELYRLARQDYLVVPDINDPNFQHGSDDCLIFFNLKRKVGLVNNKCRRRIILKKYFIWSFHAPK